MALIASLALAEAFAQHAPRVVASTSWTAAFAKAAGAKDIVTIAPFELRHPPEYEIKPSDLLLVAGADFLVHSGYERFAKQLAETAGSQGLKILPVYTDNIPTSFKEEARKLAQAFGTVPDYETWSLSFDETTSSMKARVQAAFPEKKVVAHKYLKT
jgi:zinc transport system substrate-binding protein